MAGLRVTAPLVAVKTSTGATQHLYAGDVVPEGVTKESVELLTDLGYVEDVEADDKPARKSSSK